MTYEVKHPVAFHTVDIAPVRGTFKKELLLIQKKSEVGSGKWRFPGGFTDVTDESTEEAAIRELREETNITLSGEDMFYLGSKKIIDPRYKDGPHGILTSFYLVNFNNPQKHAEAGDDAAAIKWFALEEIKDTDINDVHSGLWKMLKTHYDQYLYYKKLENIEKELTHVFVERIENFKNDGKKVLDIAGDLAKKAVDELKTMLDRD